MWVDRGGLGPPGQIPMKFFTIIMNTNVWINVASDVALATAMAMAMASGVRRERTLSLAQMMTIKYKYKYTIQIKYIYKIRQKITIFMTISLQNILIHTMDVKERIGTEEF